MKKAADAGAKFARENSNTIKDTVKNHLPGGDAPKPTEDTGAPAQRLPILVRR